MSKPCILSIDQGTTSSRAIAFDLSANILTQAQEEFPQHYPAEGWVEHDPEDIWRTTLATARAAFSAAEDQGYEVVGIGITNQRETTVVWDRRDGKAIYPAIVWQDRRTAQRCRELAAGGSADKVTAKSGLLLDPYFSATKVSWILDEVAGARTRAQAGELAFGTVDSFLIHRLTGGTRHVTDATNASRTNLFNIHTQQWDPDLLTLFDVPDSVLPEVLDCAAHFGDTDPDLFGRAVPILGVAGDQQAAAIGQCCFDEGAIKSTYGTGCFVLLNTGSKVLQSRNRLLSTVCYRLEGQTTYALEGSIFIAGAAIQWLRDELQLISHAADSQALAEQLTSNGGVYLVPAFTGLGAPHWDPDARGAIVGLTRGSGRAQLARAALESVVYQTHDLLHAMAQDGVEPKQLRVDGGMVANDWMVQFLADILDIPVDRPRVLETTALGAAYLAGLKAGLYDSTDAVESNWQMDRRFEASMSADARSALLSGWGDAVKRTLA